VMISTVTFGFSSRYLSIILSYICLCLSLPQILKVRCTSSFEASPLLLFSLSVFPCVSSFAQPIIKNNSIIIDASIDSLFFIIILLLSLWFETACNSILNNKNTYKNDVMIRKGINYLKFLNLYEYISLFAPFKRNFY